MLDDDYKPGQIPDYGMRAQPALVARMTPHLRLTQAGNVLALLGLVASIAALVTFPLFPGMSLAAPIIAVVASALLLAICTFQHVTWLLAMREWRGEHDYDLAPLARASWILHLVSYLVVIVGLFAAIAGSAAAQWSSTAAVLLALALLFMVAAQVCGGVQYLRTTGPPGTIPAHMRQLVQRARPRNKRPGE